MATTAEVVKSPADQRMYRHVTLENKLQVLLIHDAVTEKSSAALDVHVGHFSDPEEVAGLAHFCEHMLFLGTEKYPDEAEYNQYLGKHGGMSNAYTSTENTNYYFDVKQEHFGGALDRFAQFFVAPLFTREATDRELNAIESENSKNLQNDMWRSFQLEKSLSSPGHPFHKFGTGSNQTLIDMPRANGVDIRDELIDFHSKYYSANLMRLVILGREPLDELQTMATSMFSGIPNKDAAQPSFGDTTPYGLEQRSRIVKVVPVKEMKVLQMTWPLPPQEAHYKAKATRYFGHLTGHEGAGSILALLKKEGWADGLSAGEGSSASDFSSFTISIELTTEGLENYEQVAAIVFQYIGMLHREGISKRVWEEEQAVAAMSFRFLEKGEPASTTSRYAGWMQQYPPTETLTGAYLFSNFDLEHMEAVQKCLNVESCMLTLQAQELEAETTYEERWYKTKYIAQPISPETLASFKQAMGAPRDADLFMPPENLFIPKDFELKPAPEGVGTGPALLVDTPLLKLWHTNLSHKFKKPKAIVHVDLSTPVAYYSPTNAVLCRLFSKMVEDGLNEFAYEAEVAGLHYELYSTTEGMRLALSGYNDKILLLLDAVCKKVATFDDWAEQQRFDLLKEQTRREYSNFFLNQPYEIARYMQSQLLTLQKWHMQNYLEALPGLDLPELKTFSAQLLSQLCITMLVGGNLTEAEARAAATTVETSLTPAPLTALVESQIPRERAIKLEVGKDLVYSLPGYNAEEDNGAAVLFCEVSHRVVRLEACTDLLVQVANKPAFEILRTKQQLGYIVFTYKEVHQGVSGLGFIVQSNVKSPAIVDTRVNKFLLALRQIIVDMADEEYGSHVAAVVTAKTEPDKRLSQEITRAWGEIASRPAKVNFERRHVLATAVQSIPKSELLGFFDTYIVPGASQRASLSVRVVSAKFAEEYAANPSGLEEKGAELIVDPPEGEAPSPSDAGALAADAAVVGEQAVEYTPNVAATIPEKGYAAWKAQMGVHPATRVEDDGLEPRQYKAS